MSKKPRAIIVQRLEPDTDSWYDYPLPTSINSNDRYAIEKWLRIEAPAGKYRIVRYVTEATITTEQQIVREVTFA